MISFALIATAAGDTTGMGTYHMSRGQAIILGIVEGLTEYLPISSTGHLYLTQRLMGIGESGPAKAASDAYAICIQIGAILAVLWLYFRRVRAMVMGLLGRDAEGRRMAMNLIAAFLPAVAVGVALEKPIKHFLFGMWPITAAWFVGGAAILIIAAKHRDTGQGHAIGDLTWRQSLLIGAAQCLAMWPGTSRSLVTIIGGVAIGLSVPAAVEFSFLLGLVTLSAATAFEGLKQGGQIVATFGLLNPLIGIVTAFVSAVLAVKLMVSFLNRNALSWFGAYRILLAVAVGAALLLGKL
jgi:undecaprenyl-diphosphatase